MSGLTKILVLLVAFEHLYIMVLEMYFNESRSAQKSFNLEVDFLKDERVKKMMMNQGLYNGFLAMGLVWSLLETGIFQIEIVLFFLLCVICAAIYGAITVSPKIFLLQGMPGIAAMASLFI